MTIGEVLSTTMTVGLGRKVPDEVDERANHIGWSYGLAGVVLLIVVQLALVFIPMGGGGPLPGEVTRDLLLVAFVGLVVPFIVFPIAAAMAHTTARLPGAFLYLGIALAILQVVSAVLTTFNIGSTFMLGVLGVVVGAGARNFLKVGTAGGIVVGILAVAAFVGAGLLLLWLPTGRYFR